MHSPKMHSETRTENRKRYIVKPILFLAAGMWLASVSAWADGPKDRPQKNGPKEAGPKVTGAAYLNWAENQIGRASCRERV